MDAPTLGDRCQYLADRAAQWLPDRAAILLSGEPPVVVDGQPLDPQIQLSPDLRGLPPAIVAVAGYDILRDEGEAYAEALAATGCEVELVRFHGLVHGFVHMTGVSSAARAALVALARRWGARLEKGRAA